MTISASREVVQTVEEIASFSGQRERFTELAAAAAARFGAEVIPQLRTLYHGNPNPPPQYAEAFSGLGHWLSARQFAVFEIYFHLGRASLPELRAVAFGGYDWIQGNALQVLCRFAAAGIERDAILQEIKAASPDFVDEATIYAVAPLIPHEDTLPGLKDVLTFLREEAGFGWAYDTARISYLERLQLLEQRRAGTGQEKGSRET